MCDGYRVSALSLGEKHPRYFGRTIERILWEPFEKELVLFIKNCNAEAPLSLLHKGIRWKYNLPSTPHQGGEKEQLVRSCMRVFSAV